MTDPRRDPDFDRVISKASEYARTTDHKMSLVVEPAPPWWRLPLFVVALVAFAGVVVYNLDALTGRPDIPPASVIRHDLRVSTALLVEEIEAFRAEHGRAPTPAEVAAEELLAEGESYQAGAGGYRIEATDGVDTVRYESGTPLAAWVAGREVP